MANTNYNYREAMYDDIKEYISENINLSDYDGREELEEYLNDTLWTEDSVTGNASGSYWFSSYKAEEAICHNWDILAEACNEFCCECDVLNKGAEWADVTIRCYLLGEVIGEVLDEVIGEILDELYDD